MDLELNRYTDSYGTWVRVGHDQVVAIGFEDDIRNPESRMSTNWVYLAADDGVRFIKSAKEQRYDVKVRDTDMVELSTIRQMAAYNKDFLLFVPLPGRLIEMYDDLWRIVRVSRRGGGRIFMQRESKNMEANAV